MQQDRRQCCLTAVARDGKDQRRRGRLDAVLLFVTLVTLGIFFCFFNFFLPYFFLPEL